MKRTSIRLITLAALSSACLAANLFGSVQAASAPNAKLPVVAV
ncbi:MAG TPA: efflux RND transporter periplasmic adaptor subunit, partial [Sutterella wadsworthensis]|nr:efflux RND transporter periplasmic adaptor subunit [Sutterella wadsworthensis]